MARIKKFAPEQKLSSFQTFLVDENPNSDYFRITEFKDTFTGGKNGFLIEGSEYLKESTEIKIEILDVNGDPIYYEPGNGIPEYYEGISKLIAVYIYEDTPIGLGKITILGELKEYDENGVKRPVPSEWQGAYNVKWERTFQINKNLANEDRVRFYRRPKVAIDEIVKPIFNNNSNIVTQTGTINGIPLVPIENTNLSNFTLPTSYRLSVNSGNNWTGSIEGQTITFDNINYSPVVNEVVNETELIVSPPYTVNNLVKPFTNEDYSVSFNYLEGVTNLATALTGSFAKINITDMKTFVGDAARIKVFRRSQSNLTDYEFVQEIQLESNELLRDIVTNSSNEETYGYFTEPLLEQYWVTSSNDFNVSFNRNFLYNSAKLDSTEGNYFFTTESLDFQSGVEYTLDFNVRKETANSTDYLKAFLSGSLNGTPKSQTIVNVPSANALLQKQNYTENIIADSFDNARLYFEVEGSDWYINNVSLKASQETSFSPDEITFIQNVPKTLAKETFDYRFEFYDINNNYIPVLVEQTKTFDGGNLNLFNKEITITPNNLYFAFDSASAPANPLPPTTIIFDIETRVITGSVTFTSGAYDEFGNLISDSEYVGGQYPGLLKDIQTNTPTLNVADFTGSRDDILVQYIRFTGEVEGVSDEVVITRVQDGKGGVNFEIRPYRGTIIKNKSNKDLEVQAIRIDGVNEIVLRDGLPQRGFSDAKLRILSSSIDPVSSEPSSSYLLLSEATAWGAIRGVSAGLTGSGEIDYNAVFNRDSIDGELTVFLMDGPTSSSILTSLILTDLQDGLASGFVTFDTEQFGIKPRIEKTFTPTVGKVTGSFYLRGTNSSPISGTLDVYPSMSRDPETLEPFYYMFYVTGAFDRRIGVEVTDFANNVINSGIPGVTSGVPFYEAVQTKQLTTKFTYTEDITSASISVDKTFFAAPDGLPGADSIVVNIDPNPVTLNADQRGRVFNYTTANTDITVTQGTLPLIFTSSQKPGTFTTESITPNGITYSGLDLYGSPSMSLNGFNNMTDLTASVLYSLEIHPYFTASYYTGSFKQNFKKSIDGAAAINVELEPVAVTLAADEIGKIENNSGAITTLKVKQGDEYLEYHPGPNVLPGTFSASLSSTNITILNFSASNLESTDRSLDDTLHYSGHTDFTSDSASVDYSITVYPLSITNGIVSGSQSFTKKQVFTKSREGVKSRSVNLSATTTVVNYNADGVVTSPVDTISGEPTSIFLTAEAFNTTSSLLYYQFYQDGFAVTFPQLSNEYEIGSGDFPALGQTQTFKVELRDGANNSPVKASTEITIAGVQSGANNYQVFLTNPAASVLVETDGSSDVAGTGTQIKAFKGTQELTNVSTYSSPTLDLVGDPIGSFGEFSASLFSKPAYINQPNIPIGNPATIGDISVWTNPQDNKSAVVVYKVDIENGRATYFLSQSLTTVFEGAVGPGLVMRGQWNERSDYIGIVETDSQRIDAVIYPDPSGSSGETHYFRAISGSGPTTIPPGVQRPPAPENDNDYWQYLGQQDFFVAAKMAIFEESFVKNTINVGSPSTDYSVNPQIAIHGGDSEPYISIGQGTQGYGHKGVFIGVTEDGGPLGSAGTAGLLSIENDTGNRYLRWNGVGLEIAGTITVTGGNAATSDAVSGSFSTNDSTSSLENPTSYAFGGGGFTLDNVPSPTAGLHLGADKLGYHDGSNWNAYLDNDGNFYLGGSTGGALKFTQDTGNLNVTGIISASAGEFGGWVIDNSGIYYPSTYTVGNTYTTRTVVTHSFAYDSFLGQLEEVPIVDGGTSIPTGFENSWYAITRGPDPYYGSGSAFLTAYGLLTTEHIVSSSASGSIDGADNTYFRVAPGLYAAQSSYELTYYNTGSFDLTGGGDSSKTIEWNEGSNQIQIDPAGSETWEGALTSQGYISDEWFHGNGDSNVPYHHAYLYAYDVPVTGVGNVLHLAIPLEGLQSSNTLVAKINNEYAGSGIIYLDQATSLTLYVVSRIYPGQTINFGSLTAGSFGARSVTGEAMRISTSGSLVGQNLPYISMGQISASYDSTGMFLGFPSGSTNPYFSMRSGDGNYFRYDGNVIQMSGDINGATIEGADIIGGSINVPAAGTGSLFSVDAQGTLSASNASIGGIINAQSGRIGDWIIDATTAALRDENSEIIFDPNIPELQFYTGSEKKVIISPLDTLTDTAGGGITAEFSTISDADPVTLSGVVSKQSSATSITFQYSSITPGSNTTIDDDGVTSDGKFAVSPGDVNLTLDIPSLYLSAPSTTVAHTTSYPSYSPPYTGYIHGGTSLASRGYAAIYVEIVDTDNGNAVLGRTKLASVNSYSAYTTGNYYVGDVVDDGGGGGITPSSVTGDTLITLPNGKKIRVDEFVKKQKLKAWSWNDKIDDRTADIFDEFEVSNIRKRKVNKVYKVVVGDKEVKVSDTHGFWLDNNEEICVLDIIEGKTKIYVVDGDTIKLQTVDRVEEIHADEWVYTLEVPLANNYVSNDILSHNAVSGVWNYTGTTTVSSIAGTYAGSNGESVSISVSTGATNAAIRYSVELAARSGRRYNVDSVGSTTTQYIQHTVYYNKSTSPGTAGYLGDNVSTAQIDWDTDILISVPSNFVEIKAGGIQVVSEPDIYVQIPRKTPGSSNPHIFYAEGGQSRFTALDDAGFTFDTAIVCDGMLEPGQDDKWDLGATYFRWDDIYATNGTINTSDRNQKANISGSDLGLSFINSLLPVSYNFVNGKVGRTHYGLIAQDVETTLDSFNKTSYDFAGLITGSNYGLRYHEFISPMVKAIQELSDKVSQLEAQISGSNP